MKNLIKFIAILFIWISCLSVSAQVPDLINYQGVARDNNGAVLNAQQISLRISILTGTVNGSSQYTETHLVTTNAYGLFVVSVGGGSVVSGNFTNITWGTASKFLKVEMDVTGGSNYANMGTSQLLSVPYALASKVATSDHDTSATNEVQSLSLVGNDLTISGGNTVTLPTGVTASGGVTKLLIQGDVTDVEAAAQIAAQVGQYTQEIVVQNTTSLTSLDLSAVVRPINITFTNNPLLTTVNLNNVQIVDNNISLNNNPVLAFSMPALTRVFNIIGVSNNGCSSFSTPALIKGGDFTFGTSAPISINISSLTTLTGILNFNTVSGFTSYTVPSLQTCRELYVLSSSFTSMSFPNLQIASSYFKFDSNANLTSISAPNLVTTGSFVISNNSALPALSFPSVQHVSIVMITPNPVLASIDFPVLHDANTMNLSLNPQLTSISHPNIVSLPANLSTYKANGCKLPVSNINSILVVLQSVTYTGTGGTINLSGQTPTAPPSGVGLTAKTALIAAGRTVTTD